MPRQYTPRIERVCQICGKTFWVQPNVVAVGKGLYCSRSCHSKSKKGVKHPRYKAEGHVDYSTGYVVIARPDGGKALEHRYVMECHLGRPLRSDEHVHHINENKRDNRIENLQIVDAAKHQRIHRTLPAGRWSRDYERCIVCGTDERRYGGHGMCRLCYRRSMSS